MTFDRTNALRATAHALIPGGTHTYAKGDDQFPQLSPGFIVRGKGCHAWDVDGNEFIEYGMGLRAVTLGHAYGPVVDAAAAAMRDGVNFTRPSPLEVECAERFLELIDGADMVKFCKNGSDATTAAVKLARAHTGRDLVAVCADQPFFSTDDWFIGTMAMNAGIPAAISSLTVTFRYNDVASVERLFAEHLGRIACIVMEAETTITPADGFLHKVRDLCHHHGAVFILDEMITGFRWHNGGAQKKYDVVPDLSTFGKALANGFSLSALAGKREIMELGGLRHARERVFLLSTTHGAETHTLAAGMATMRAYCELPVVEHLWRAGERLAAGVSQMARELGVNDYVRVMGRPCNLVYTTLDRDKQRSQPFRTLFLQELIRNGVIAPSFVVSHAHTDADIDHTIEVVRSALIVYARALEEGVDKYLVGPSVKPVMRKHN